MMRRYTYERIAFQHAKQRCTNPHAAGWKNYGGRGIEFRFSSFDEFFAELGPRPKGLTLDRKNNDGHYDKGNVRWATRREQIRNQRHDTEAQNKARLKGGYRVHKLHPRLARKIGRAGGLLGGPRRAHLRWHVARGIVSPTCKLCQVIK